MSLFDKCHPDPGKSGMRGQSLTRTAEDCLDSLAATLEPFLTRIDVNRIMASADERAPVVDHAEAIFRIEQRAGIEGLNVSRILLLFFRRLPDPLRDGLSKIG